MSRALIEKIGMYFKPALILPFSTMDTIREAKNAIISIAAIEKFLKSVGSTLTSLMEKGKSPTPPMPPDNLDTKLRITIKRLNESENNKGAITITIAAIKIM